MALLPPEVLYGKVTGQFLSAQLDTLNDVDDFPDSIPILGNVTFKPSATSLQDAIGKAIILPMPIRVTLDAFGRVVSPSGNIGIYLVASDSPNLSPLNFTYNVSFDLVGVALNGFNFFLPHDQTIDLSSQIQANATSGQAITTSPSNVIYQHGKPTDPSLYPRGFFVVDIDDNNHTYEIGG